MLCQQCHYEQTSHATMSGFCFFRVWDNCHLLSYARKQLEIKISEHSNASPLYYPDRKATPGSHTTSSAFSPAHSPLLWDLIGFGTNETTEVCQPCVTFPWLPHVPWLATENRVGKARISTCLFVYFSANSGFWTKWSIKCVFPVYCATWLPQLKTHCECTIFFKCDFMNRPKLAKTA